MYGTLDEQQKDERAELSAGDQRALSTSNSAQLLADGAAASLARNDSQSRWLDSAAAPGERTASRRKRKIFSHCHMASGESAGTGQAGAGEPAGVDKSARSRLIVASVICLLFMIGEIVGGVLSGSLAIATDAAHLLTDFASFMISLFAIWLSSRPASRKMSFGWYRAEVIGALLSVLMIWLVTGLLVYMAVERLRTGEFEIDATVMVITAGAGLLVNIIMAIALNVDGHGHSHGHSHSHAHDIRGHSHLEHVHDEDEDEDEDEEHEDEQLEAAADPQEHVHIAIVDSTKEADLLTRSLIEGADCKQRPDPLAASSLPNGRSHHEAPLQRNTTTITTTTTTTAATTTATTKSKKKKKKKKLDQCNGDGSQSQQGRGRSNINVRAAFIHVIGDFLQSLGVLIAALVIYFEPGYAIVDPICTFLFSIIVLVTTLNIIRDATNVLMEGIPDGINFIEVREKLQTLPGVMRVHNLRIWSLSLDKIAISTHLVIDAGRISSAQALKRAIETLKSSYSFLEVTIQIEEYREDMKDCQQCQDDDDDGGAGYVINMIDNHQQTNGSTTTPSSTRQPDDGAPA